MLDRVRDTAAAATDLFVFYFAGHGFVELESDELFLALPGTDRARPWTGLSYDWIRRASARTVPAAEPTGVADLDHVCRNSRPCRLDDLPGRRQLIGPEHASRRLSCDWSTSKSVRETKGRSSTYAREKARLSSSTGLIRPQTIADAGRAAGHNC
ncbi:hypothetical protein ACIA5G_14855 [Amycolatopsis sp. NPDC051758]|uniref:hypothetical protein n=1 Tax=Amycolatopsis sp. NPDC051758 TaxID=3363935 RepID=UPI0037A2C280